MPQAPDLAFCEMCGADLMIHPPAAAPSLPTSPVLPAASAVAAPVLTVPAPAPTGPRRPGVDRAMRTRLVVVSEPASAIPDFEAPCTISLGRVDAARQFEADVNFDRILVGSGRASALGVGREHAYIVGGPDGDWQIEHGGSTNSVWVNDRIRLRVNGDSARLEDGAQVRLGNLELRFELLP
jgi:hypothetical protein